MLNIEPIQEGSGDPSPENVRPITGRTGAAIYQTGKNIYDKNAIDTSNGYVAGSYLAGNGTEIELSSWNISEYIEIDNTNVILSVPIGYSPSICFYDINKQFISGNSYQNRKTIQITAPANAKYVRISVPVNMTDSVRLAYGTNINISWETEAGTVYGGYIDVVSGQLTVDRIKLNATAWTKDVLSSGVVRFYTREFNSIIKKSPNTTPGNIISSFLITTYANAGYSGLITNSITIDTVGSVSCYPDRNGTVAGYTATEFKTYTDGQQIIAALAEPITHQLTPQQINALFGTNVVWSDAANNIEMQYTGYIDD